MKENNYWEDRKLIEALGFEHDQTTKKDGAWFYKGTLMDKEELMLNYKDGIVEISNISNIRNIKTIYKGNIENYKNER